MGGITGLPAAAADRRQKIALRRAASIPAPRRIAAAEALAR
jgi:hypothetical protein